VSTDAFRTAWFVESACSEILVTFAIRTRRAFWRSHPSAALFWSSLVAGVLAFALPFIPLGQEYFSFVPMPMPILGFIGLVLLAYFLSAEALKRPFFERLRI
jgi:Mg2+-importing ATPase